MQLLIFITNRAESVPKILSRFIEAGIPGATVVDCHGALRVLGQSTIDPPPAFGSLRQFLSPKYEQGKMLFSLLPEEKTDEAKAIVRRAAGDFMLPDSGVMFTLPVSDAEGASFTK